MIHPTAIIGSDPEHRDWKPGDPFFGCDIDPTARINAYVTVDGGHIRPTKIGARTWLMKQCHVGHDVLIGDDCELAPGTVIGGYCVIGNGVRFGVGVMVRPGIRIGDGARLGAGAVVVKNVPPDQVWVGNPAGPIQRRPRLPEAAKRLQVLLDRDTPEAWFDSDCEEWVIHYGPALLDYIGGHCGVNEEEE